MLTLATHHLEGRQSVDLYQSMAPAEDNGDGQENDVARVAAEETHELDNLGEAEDEDNLCPKSLLAALHVPVGGTLPESEDDEGVEDEGQRREGSDVKSIGAPRLLTVVVIG